MYRAMALFLGCAAPTSLGCRPTPPSPTFDEKTIAMSDQMHKLHGAWNRAYQKNRRSPTAEDLKPFLREFGDVDALLKSTRDGKPLVIVPNFTPDMQGKGDELPIILYEQTGVNGKRMTIDVRATIIEMEAEEFSRLVCVGGHRPAK